MYFWKWTSARISRRLVWYPRTQSPSPGVTEPAMSVRTM